MNVTFRPFARIHRSLVQRRPIICKVYPCANSFLFRKNQTMASLAASLEDKLKSLHLEKPLAKYPNCYPEFNQTDIYRAHLTEILTEVTGVEAAVIYPALQWTQTLEKGDLVLPVPALRIKGKKPNELAEEWAAKVCNISAQTNLVVNIVTLVPRISPRTQANRCRHIPPILLQGGQTRRATHTLYSRERSNLWSESIPRT